MNIYEVDSDDDVRSTIVCYCSVTLSVTALVVGKPREILERRWIFPVLDKLIK